MKAKVIGLLLVFGLVTFLGACQSEGGGDTSPSPGSSPAESPSASPS